MDYLEIGWQTLDQMITIHTNTHHPDRYPGDESICRLLSTICTEEDIPVRFYYHEGCIEVEVLGDGDPDWVLLFECFVRDYDTYLLPETGEGRDVRDALYEVVGDHGG